MKRYVVTRDQILELQLSGIRYGRTNTDKQFQDLRRAQEDSMTRPVPDWATHFAAEVDEINDWLHEARKVEDIPK